MVTIFFLIKNLEWVFYRVFNPKSKEVFFEVFSEKCWQFSNLYDNYEHFTMRQHGKFFHSPPFSNYCMLVHDEIHDDTKTIVWLWPGYEGHFLIWAAITVTFLSAGWAYQTWDRLGFYHKTQQSRERGNSSICKIVKFMNSLRPSKHTRCHFPLCGCKNICLDFQL